MCESGKLDTNTSKPPVIDFIAKITCTQRAGSEEFSTILGKWKATVVMWSRCSNRIATVANNHFPLWEIVENGTADLRCAAHELTHCGPSRLSPQPRQWRLWMKAIGHKRSFSPVTERHEFWHILRSGTGANQTFRTLLFGKFRLFWPTSLSGLDGACLCHSIPPRC